MNNNDKSVALARISTINAVENFDPTPLAVEYTDLNTQEKRLRLPVVAQVAWFRLKYPEGRFTLHVTSGKDCFVADARVYKDYKDPADCFLSEASASRGYLSDKPTVSPREWAQTAALGIALRNAGFGLQFHAAGESFDDPVINEIGQLIEAPPALDAEAMFRTAGGQSEFESTSVLPQREAESTIESDEDPLEAAKKIPCPSTKYKGKTLGDMISMDPGYLAWVANKFSGNHAISEAARLICETALAATA